MALTSDDFGKDRESGLTHGSLYRFGQFVLDPRRRALSRSDSPVFLTPKAFDVLTFLVQNPNRLVTKEELLQAVWGDTFVEEGNLTQYISHLRKALGGNSEDTRLIVTIARKGYQFTGDVTVAETADAATEAEAQIPTARKSGANVRPIPELPASAAVSEAPWQRVCRRPVMPANCWSFSVQSPASVGDLVKTYFSEPADIS